MFLILISSLILVITTKASNSGLYTFNNNQDGSYIQACFINQTRECFNSTCQNSPSSSSSPGCFSKTLCKKKQQLFDLGNKLSSNSDSLTEYECSWYLNAPTYSYKYLYLKVNKFFLKSQVDFFYIFNGTSYISPLTAAITGEIADNTILIFTNMNSYPSIYILFKCKSSLQTANFSIEYYFSNEEISQTLFTSSIAASATTPINSECIQPITDSSYDYKADVLNSKRASHRIHLLNKTELFIFGGYSFDFYTQLMNDVYDQYSYVDKDFNFINYFNLKERKLREVNNKNTTTHGPLRRYEFSTIYDATNSRIIMFGGILIGSFLNGSNKSKKNYDDDDSMIMKYILSLNNPAFRYISDEIWSFDLNKKTWKLIDSINASSSESVPIAVCGHSSILFKDTMLTFFGFSRYYGFLPLIQEFNMTSNIWSIRNFTNIQLFDEHFPIGFKHSSVLDETTNLIYIYGGLIIKDYIEDQTPTISNCLLVYNPQTNSIKLLQESYFPSYAHSANIFGDSIYVFGGIAINKTTGLAKMTKRIRIYNISENIWYNEGNSDAFSSLVKNKGRYSHSSFIFNSSLCIHGGFNGFFLNDLFCIDFKCLNADISSNRNSTSTNLSNVNGAMIATILEYKNCYLYNDCFSCQFNPLCMWYQDQCFSISSFEITNGQNNDVKYLFEKKTCRILCFKLDSCDNCTQSPECMWCLNTNLCLHRDQFNLIYSFGQCIEYINETNKCRKNDAILPFRVNSTSREFEIKTNLFGCLDYKNCSSCVQQESCGWCSLDDNKTGYGICMDALTNINNDSTSLSYCNRPNWYFDSCQTCECNGHSQCSDDLAQCLMCANNTKGNRCETCGDGYFGVSLNNGVCSKCNCNSQATECNADDGSCFCSTKGVSGKYCSVCEQPRYFGNPAEPNGTCYYDLSIDYQFTFNLNKESDKYYSQIHFSNKPTRFDDDIDLTIKCVKYTDALFNVTYILWYDYDIQQLTTTAPTYSTSFYNSTLITMPTTSSSLHTDEIQLLNAINCTNNEYKHTFTSKDDNYYILANNLQASNAFIKNRTFFVYVYNFKTPIIIQISFTHKTRIQLLHFFITFFGCFLTLLAIAFILWKSKQRYDHYQRQRRLIFEMKQMASRPFSKLCIDLNSNELQKENALKNQEFIMPVAVQPLTTNKSAVLTVLLQLPDGKGESNSNNNGGHTNKSYENDRYTSPFVFGSTLVYYDPTELSEQLDGNNVENNDKTIIVDIK